MVLPYGVRERNSKLYLALIWQALNRQNGVLFHKREHARLHARFRQFLMFLQKICYYKPSETVADQMCILRMHLSVKLCQVITWIIRTERNLPRRYLRPGRSAVKNDEYLQKIAFRPRPQTLDTSLYLPRVRVAAQEGDNDIALLLVFRRAKLKVVIIEIVRFRPVYTNAKARLCRALFPRFYFSFAYFVSVFGVIENLLYPGLLRFAHLNYFIDLWVSALITNHNYQHQQYSNCYFQNYLKWK